MPRQSRPAKRQEGGSNWMDTYGDMVTLLLTFFVLLFAFSSVDNEKWNTLVEAFTGSPPKRNVAAVDMLTLPDFSDSLPSSNLDMFARALDEEETEEEIDETTQAFTPEQLAQLELELSEEQRRLMSTQEYQDNEEQFSQIYERLVIYIEVNGLEDMLFASRDMESIYLRVAAGVLFDSGKADILPAAEPILDTLEDIFVTAGDSLAMLSVEGHTDTVPIHTARFRDNWELSCSRAASVMHYFLDKGRLAPEMFNISGYGEYRPVAENDTEEGKQQNRRVEFVLRKKILTTEDVEQ